MTVKELIEELEKMEPSAEVLFDCIFLEERSEILKVDSDFRRNEKTDADDPIVLLLGD